MIYNLGELKNKKASLTHLIKTILSNKEKQKDILKDLKRKDEILEKKLEVIEEVEDRYDILDLKDIKDKREEEIRKSKLLKKSEQ